MKKTVKLIQVLFFVLAFGVSITNAEDVKVSKSTSSTKSISKNLIDLAGKQRMLSQRLAKNYLYKGQKIATSKASKQLESSLAQFELAQKELHNSINDSEIQNLLEFTAMSSDDFKELVKNNYSKDSAQLAIDLSESMLEGSQYVVDSLKIEESEIVAKAGKQRMLAQRIAKYYISYQAGIKDKNTIDQMRVSVGEFSKSHDWLMKNKTNSAEINQKLNEIDKLWRIVYKFYLSIEKGGLPFIVFTTTDDITKKMDYITGLYIKQ